MALAHRAKWLAGGADGADEAVTAAITAVGKAIRAEIGRRFASHAVAESGDLVGAESEGDEAWLVEPIDGQVNFARGVPFFGVSLAYRRAGQYRVGVVYDPSADELFQGCLGRGAKLNGQPIFVEHVGEGASAYRQAVLGTDWPADRARRAQALGVAALLAGSSLGVSLMGSPALGLSYVAAGRLHGYWHLQLRLSQVAAARVILDEAGGVLTNIRGASWLFADGAYLATNGVIHGEVLRNARAILGQGSGPTGQGAASAP